MKSLGFGTPLSNCFVPDGWRQVCPGEMVEPDDWFWDNDSWVIVEDGSEKVNEKSLFIRKKNGKKNGQES